LFASITGYVTCLKLLTSKNQSPSCTMAAAIKSGVNDLLEKLNITSPKEQEAPPKEPTAEQLQTLRETYEKANQEHLFAFYDELDTESRAALYEQLSGFDPKRINILADKALHPPKTDDSKKPSVEPLPGSATASLLDLPKEDIEKWYNTGLGLIADNKVGVVLMAGGQGTRLGSSAPKGCFDIGLPSKKSLFQMQGERILKVQQLAQKYSGSNKVVVPWYVMTSGPTRKPTEDYFRAHNYFGLEEEDVIIFEQGVLPCISNEGKILMESKSKV
jgi:UDP-N-acetylglucosamine/UDP-N-acetylgalactosamine diphosphorylase